MEAADAAVGGAVAHLAPPPDGSCRRASGCAVGGRSPRATPCAAAVAPAKHGRAAAAAGAGVGSADQCDVAAFAFAT